MRVFYSLCFISLILNNCKSRSEAPPSSAPPETATHEVVAQDTTAPANVPEAAPLALASAVEIPALAVRVSLAEEDAQTSYLFLAEGRKEDLSGQDESRVLHGLAKCQRSVAGKTCSLLSTNKHLPLSHDVSAQLWQVLAEKNLLAEKETILWDMLCEYIGPSSPPFQITMVRCHATDPRSTSETIFHGALAEKLAVRARGDETLPDGVTEVRGFLDCLTSGFMIAGCTVRPVNTTSKAGKTIEVLGDAVRALSDEDSQHIVMQLRNTLAKKTTLEATQEGEKNPAANSPEKGFSGGFSCLVDSSQLVLGENRQYLCRVGL